MNPSKHSPSLILASTSASRQALLRGAGVIFTAEAAGVDERVLEAQYAAIDAADVAIMLAQAKTLAVSERRPGALVIGADQTLGLDGRSFHKPASIADARAQLIALRGRTHRLNSGIAAARDGTILFRHVAIADMTMRRFSDVFLDHYMATVGEKVLMSVGCYQLEGPGIQLFEVIDGDYFTILGLPLLPLLTFLRTESAIDD